MITLEEIFEDFKRGKLEPFYRHVYAKLLLYASRQLGTDYAFLAEDLVQDAVCKAYEQQDAFASAAVFKSFFYSCIHNAAVDILRKNKAQENYLSQQEEHTEFLSGIIEQETLDLLYDAIDELPEKYRRIFELNFREGLKNAEIAALLGVTESAVKKQKATMIELVRKSLKEKTGDPLLAAFIVLRFFAS